MCVTSMGTPQLVRGDCWPCQRAQGKVFSLAELPSASKLPLLRCSSAGIRHGNGPDLFWNNRMKWCKGKCYTKERDKSPRAKSARRKRMGGTSLPALGSLGAQTSGRKVGRWQQGGVGQAERKALGAELPLGKAGRGPPKSPVCVPPPAGRAEQRCSSRLRAPGGFLAVWHHLLGLPGNKAGLAPRSFSKFSFPKGAGHSCPAACLTAPRPLGLCPAAVGGHPGSTGVQGGDLKPPRPALSPCLGAGGSAGGC